MGLRRPWGRRAGGGDIDDAVQHNRYFVSRRSNALPAPLHLAGDAGVRPHEHPRMHRRQQNPIICHEARKSAAAPPLLHERESERALARARRAPDEHAGLADHNRCAMNGDRRGGRHQRTDGSHTVKRAPATPPPPGFSRFAAWITPPCASTIWREMERPRPEFWPNPCSGRSV